MLLREIDPPTAAPCDLNRHYGGLKRLLFATCVFTRRKSVVPAVLSLSVSSPSLAAATSGSRQPRETPARAKRPLRDGEGNAEGLPSRVKARQALPPAAMGARWIIRRVTRGHKRDTFRAPIILCFCFSSCLPSASALQYWCSGFTLPTERSSKFLLPHSWEAPGKGALCRTFVSKTTRRNVGVKSRKRESE